MSSLNLTFWDLNKNKIKNIIKLALVIVALSVSFLQIEFRGEKTLLQTFHAGSLTGPFSTASSIWGFFHPEYEIDNEAYGSATAIRQVTELGRQADLVASADYSLIESMMMNQKIPGTNLNFTNWYIIFARNKMVLAYVPQNNPPLLYNLINHINPWWKILSFPGVKFGRADPWQDPCGYRTLMIWGLADKYYNLTKSKNPQLINFSLYLKDPIMGYSGPDATVIKSKEIDLIASLKTGEIDYLFIYESVARQHGLLYFQFDDHIDLSNFTLEEFYNKVSVNRRSPLVPGKSSPPKKAKTIQYGLTIPINAPHPLDALVYVHFLLTFPQILELKGLKTYFPAYASDIQKIPPLLRPLCVNYPSS